ncbi:hypothetical protein BD324DRAFT_683372 [Kockovaella imperatae]|uniref:RNA polymerase II elongation factor ELL N-terminal domain-containing protein n=1 Tax=Kockovaella imperatae TaxID=4999 RepID=A0A1Y1U8Q6_9TREE|nr:hypothetical protein BD324DRAFT_683372 [Kockovaella imperatae]ORX34421.1 hypothetical protein BD324DRAFT_683372 [Kockovaella imperatae]
MALPFGSTQLVASSSSSSSSSKPAYLFRPSQEVWTKLQAASNGLSISFQGDEVSLHIPGSAPIHLAPQASNTPSEVYTLKGDRLDPLGIATSRLTTPIGSNNHNRGAIASGLKTPSTAHFNHHAKPHTQGEQMGRVYSSPGLPSSMTVGGEPIIPLKTRVIQALSLGPMSLEKVVKRVGMPEEDVMRVVRVVGKDLGEGRYTLQPAKYAQVKIASWKYTLEEQRTVVRLAREAFDELGLPSDAEERVDLAQKESEIKESEEGESDVKMDERDTLQVPPIPAPSARKETSAQSTPISSPQIGPIHAGGANSSDSGTKDKASGNAVAGKKKSKGSLGLIGRERAKFAAQQQRASSLPNAQRATSNVASPRLDPTTTVPTTGMASGSSNKAAKAAGTTKRKRNDDDGKSRPDSPADSSAEASNSGESAAGQSAPRGRTKEAKPIKPTTTTSGDGKPEMKKQKSKARPPDEKLSATTRDYSSSDSGSEVEATPLSKRKTGSDHHPQSAPLTHAQTTSSIPTFKRKAPPPVLDLGEARNGASQTEPKTSRPDEESLRDRYEELFPAYQLYTKKLVKIQEALDHGEEGEVVDEVEVERMVKKWQKWHRELEDIRRWFGDGSKVGV